MNTVTSTTVTMTPFSGHVRTLIWGSCKVDRPSLMHIPRIVAGGDTPCDPPRQPTVNPYAEERAQAEDIIGALQLRHAVDPSTRKRPANAIPVDASMLRRGADGVWEVHAEEFSE